MSQVPVWFERKFEFSFPVERYPTVCARLRGTPPRLEAELRDQPHNLLTAKSGDQWSIQEHAGHLLDLEALWIARVQDFLADRDTLTAADLTNRKTHEAKHNARPLEQILADFRRERLRLLEQVAQLKPEMFAHTKLHPRLKQPMRLVDHLYFVAEHDDHHLARMWEMIHC